MLRDNDPQKWIYKEHTRAKHKLLEKYLSGWISILGSRHERLLIFDGFAGRGEYEDEVTGSPVPGSPVIIMRTAAQLMADGRVRKVICAFVEKDYDNYINLERVLTDSKTRFPNVEVIGPLNADFASVVDDVTEQTGGRLVPAFFFIDPFGFSEIPFLTVQRILALQRSEVFVTLMLRDIGRFLSRSGLDQTFDSLFGTREWRDIIATQATDEAKEHQLRDLYIRQLT